MPSGERCELVGEGATFGELYFRPRDQVAQGP